MTQEIKPTYVTFEQAKWLKEKGFKGRSRYYGGSGELVEVPNIIEYDYRHTNNEMQRFRWEAPEQWQVCEWLRVKYGIWIYVLPYSTLFRPYAEELVDNDKFGKWEGHKYSTPQEAYSAAFDYILNNNLI
jgi:hypothetical protein